jgi:hypothetical protein
VRRYVIVLAVMAVLIGSLFKAGAQTGVRLMNMFATIGVFLFGVVGTLALTRWQSREGHKAIEAALKSLEPTWLITDWAHNGGGKPDYLLVGPGGIVAICVDETPQSSWKRTAIRKVARSRERTLAAVRWLRDRLSAMGADATALVREGTNEVPVTPLVVMTRRQAVPDYTAEGVTVVNPDQLAAHIRGLGERELLDERTRIKLTRTFRTA